MAQPKRPIQFKVLPRPNEVPPEGKKPSRKRLVLHPMTRTYAIAGLAVVAAFYFLFSDPQPVANLKSAAKKSRPEQGENSPEALVNRYLQEADARHSMEARNTEIENKANPKTLGPDAAIIQDNDRPLGVSLEQENSAEKVYNDLYGKDKYSGSIVTPEDRINARLKEDQWMATTEKQERKQYVQNFLKEAYDAGYAIDLDENLVVIRVRKVTSKPKETLDKVLENLARKGY